MSLMSVTPEVSHAPMSWLNAEASSNIPSIVVTPVPVVQDLDAALVIGTASDQADGVADRRRGRRGGASRVACEGQG